ncbi:Vps51/Vps67 family (components of vesicular transport) protein [Euphorbia peplus]|nr:Vps51/Vps67 family (components of vesicular transport) protein [Euphorbia peplus]
MAEIVLSLVVEEALTKFLGDELNRLRDSLAMVRDLLQDAEEQQLKQIRDLRWLKKLKVWAFDAEDLLDDLSYEFLQQKVEFENKKEAKGRNFVNCSFGVHFVQKTVFHIKMGHKVKKISESLDGIKNDAVNSAASAPRNLLAWDASSRLYYWDSTNRCLHCVSVRLGEPKPSSVLAASLSKYMMMRTQRVSVLLKKRFKAPNWVKHNEPREVHMFVDLFLQQNI